LARGESRENYRTLRNQAIPGTAGKFETDLVPSQRKLLGLGGILKKKTRLMAAELENILHTEGHLAVNQLTKRLKGLNRLKLGGSQTNWITKGWKEKFVIENGSVMLKPRRPTAIALPPPEPPPPEPPAQENPPVALTKPKPVPKAISKIKRPITLAQPPAELAKKKGADFFEALQSNYGRNPPKK
jgi:hypothetical protein